MSAATLFAGASIALAAGVTGWLLLLRRQLFAADALSHVAFPAALAAALVGVQARLGLLVCTIVAGLVLALLGRRSAGKVADDSTIGVLFTAILAVGLLLQTLVDRSSGEGSTAATRALFGSLTSLSTGEAVTGGLIALAAALAAALASRVLIFSWVTPGMARAAGVPSQLLEYAFMAILAVVVAVSAQAVGALLLLGLLVGPAAFARARLARPGAGIALAALVAVLASAAGLFASARASSLPASSAILAAASLPYVLLRLRRVRRG